MTYYFLKSVSLEDFPDRFSNELLGGMQQRAAFCQAMIHYPKIILLDEPLGKLDAMTREKIRADFQKLWMVKKLTDIRRWLPILFSRLCFTCPSSRPPDSTDAPVPVTLFGNRDARAGTGVERCRT